MAVYRKFSSWSLLSLYLLAATTVVRAQQGYLSETHPDYRAVRQVFDKVWEGFGSSKAPPDLVIRENQEIARYTFGTGALKPTIVVDKGLISFLRTEFRHEFPNALACILSHELAHHYHDHQQTAGFAATSNDPRPEEQADISGFFFAYTAGYASFALAERLFEKLYAHYRLDARGSKLYLPGKERVAGVRAQVATVRRLAYIYEAGKVLLLTGKPAEAASCFELVRATIPAAEIINNQGLACLLQVAQGNLLSPKEMPFALPFEPDLSQRLLMNARGLSDPEMQQRVALLRQAERIFHQGYAPGGNDRIALNLAITQLLLDNPNAAIGTINSLDRKSPEAYLVRGISYLKDGQSQRATEDFTRIKNEKSQLFAVNQEIYRQVKANGWEKAGVPPAGGQRRTSGLLLREKLPPLDYSGFKRVTQAPFPITTDVWRYGDVFSYSLPVNAAKYGTNHQKWTVAKVSGEGYDNRKKVRIGATEPELTAAYGVPDFILQTGGQGASYLYKTAQIVFNLQRGAVSGWYVYDEVLD